MPFHLHPFRCIFKPNCFIFRAFMVIIPESQFSARLYKCTGRAIVLLPGICLGSSSGVSKIVKFYIKNFIVMGKALSGELSCTRTGLVLIFIVILSLQPHLRRTTYRKATTIQLRLCRMFKQKPNVHWSQHSALFAILKQFFNY